MADTNDGDLVSNVAVQGVDQSTSELKKFGDEGAAAFDKVAEAAKKAGAEVESGAKAIASGLENIQKSAQDQTAPTRLANIADAITNLKAVAGAAVGDVVKFSATIEGIGAASLLAIAGVAKFAAKTTESFRNIGEVTKDRLRDQQALDKQGVESVRQSENYNKSLNNLTDQLRAGKLGVADYGNSITALNKKFNEEAAAQANVAAAEEDARKKNDAALRAQQQTVALTALTKAYGGPLTQSLITLGTTYEQLHKQVVEAFSPALASLVDGVSAIIDKNRTAITSFIDGAAKSLEDFIKNNGPQIEGFFLTMADIAKGLGSVLKDVVLPALGLIKDGADALAAKINEVFGTKFTGGALIAAAAVIFFSGAIGTAITVVATIVEVVLFLSAALTPLGVVIAIVVGLLIAWASTVNWKQLGADIKSAFDATVAFFSGLPAKIGAFFSELWDNSKALAEAAAQWVIDKWQATIDFLASIPDTVAGFFSDLWERIKSTAQDMFTQLGTIVQGWVTAALAFLQPVLDAIKAAKAFFSASPDSGGGGAPQLAGGGHIRGPGTSTSDSIAAWLSNNEFVMQAKAVAKYGVHFFQLLNSGKLDLGRVLGYAAGGLVGSLQGNQAPRLAFAAGGQVSRASRVLNLTIGNEQFNGLLMPDDVANKMTKFAVGKQSRSAGRRPAWVGGRR